MKTRVHNLNAIALGVALAMGSITAANAVPVFPGNPSGPGLLGAVAAEKAGPNKNFLNITDNGGLCLVESSLSLIAAASYAGGNCNASYTLDVTSDNNGVGSADIQGVRTSATLNNQVTQAARRGSKCRVTGNNTNRILGAAITQYTGNHSWSWTNSIFVDSANFLINGFPYDEHSIKDYYGRDNLTGQFVGDRWTFDWGLEVVTKLDYPVTKWAERSWYRKHDGVDSALAVRKDLVGNNCHITYVAEGYNDQFEFTYSGTVIVSP